MQARFSPPLMSNMPIILQNSPQNSNQQNILIKEEIKLEEELSDSEIDAEYNGPNVLQQQPHQQNQIVSFDSQDQHSLPPPQIHLTHSQNINRGINLLHTASKLTTNRNVYGRLSYKDAVLNISENIVEIGRNSSTSSVHFHVGRNSFVSRKHLQVLHDANVGEFYLICLSKNGVFVDDVFQRKCSKPLKLTKS